MRPDDNVLGIFKNYYERSSDAGGPLHRDLEKWFDLLSTRLRLELRLRWLRAIPAKVDPAELVKELEAVLSNFTQAGQFTSLEDARPPTSEALGDDLKRLTHEIQVAEADLPSSSDAPYTSQQAALLHLALLHEPIRYNQPTLPLPAFAPLSGMGGLSAVLFLPTDQGNGLVVAAKFDAPERSTKEWEQVNQLRDLDLPDEFVLPLRCSQRGDGVILSQAALNTDSLCTPLGGYLADCLPRAVEACFFVVAFVESSGGYTLSTSSRVSPMTNPER